MKGCVLMDKEVQLAKDIIKKLRELLEDKFSYIVNFAPRVNFYESCDELFLETIVFEADGNYQDTIAVEVPEGRIIIALEEGPCQALTEFESLEQILTMDVNCFSQLYPNIEASVKKARESYLSRH